MIFLKARDISETGWPQYLWLNLDQVEQIIITRTPLGLGTRLRSGATVVLVQRGDYPSTLEFAEWFMRELSTYSLNLPAIRVVDIEVLEKRWGALKPVKRR